MKVIVNIDVPDLARAVAFYAAALGLEPGRTMDGDVAELLGASTAIYLLKNPAGSHPVPAHPGVRHYARHWTPLHLDFVVDDVTEAAQRALAAGAIQESGCVEWRGSKCITFSDPFGNGFCVIEFAGETYAADSADDSADDRHRLPAAWR
jgi:catechol 2,3-dioxygenase-like lactoylglutathione lyase family enzyme